MELLVVCQIFIIQILTISCDIKKANKQECFACQKLYTDGQSFPSPNIHAIWYLRFQLVLDPLGILYFTM